jgi:outer membrane protein OmpA-like peptidoglycan-associated protein
MVNLARMRQFCLVLTALLGMTASAMAQVTIDLQALDALPNAKAAAPGHAVRKAAPRPTQRRVAVVKSSKSSAHARAETPATAPQVTVATSPPPSVPATPAPPAATLPTAPPSTIALAPVPPPPPAAQPEPPPPPPISATAASAATAVQKGLRVTFGAGEADLSPASAAAIKAVTQSATPDSDTTFNVVAYATGTPEDPSTARRLSLSRALAVRSALMANGVSSSHIYVRALGAAGGTDDPDRVDLAVLGGNTKSESQ